MGAVGTHEPEISIITPCKVIENSNWGRGWSQDPKMLKAILRLD